MPDSARPADSTPLNGWKEIAAYLGRSLRSVQRYEQERGLPVHRLTSADGQTVYAFRHEIDAWRQGLDEPSKQEVSRVNENEGQELSPPAGIPTGPQRLPAEPVVRAKRSAFLVGAAIAGAVCAGIVLGGVFTRARVSPLSASTVFVLMAHQLEANTADGRLIWSYTFDREVSGVADMDRVQSTPSDLAVLADIDGDGSPEAIVPVRFSAAGQKSTESDTLFAFSQDGKVRWAISPPQTLGCAAESFSGPWQIRSVTVSREPGRKKVWVAFKHHTWWPSFVLEIDPDGKRFLRYLQTGWIYSLVPWETKSGSYLVAGGVTSDGDQPIVTMIDLSQPQTASPSGDPRFACPSVAQGSPAVSYLLPNDEITRASSRVYTHVSRLSVQGDMLKVVAEAGDGVRILNVAPDFSITDMSLSDSFWFNHRAFEETGQIRHPAAKCPELGPQLISRWTLKTGWQQLHVTPTLRTTLPGTTRH